MFFFKKITIILILFSTFQAGHAVVIDFDCVISEATLFANEILKFSWINETGQELEEVRNTLVNTLERLQGDLLEVTQVIQSLTVSDFEKNLIYFIGLVDILTYYGIKKRSATAAKTVKYGSDAENISTVKPEQYAKRLVEFIRSALN